MTPVLIVGYHGKRNFGDDVFLNVVLSLIAECAGVDEFLVSGDNRSLPGLPASCRVKGITRPAYRISRLMWFDILVAALRSRAVIFAAGSIFSIVPFGLAWFTLIVLRLIKGSRIPIVALGVSTGPYRSPLARRLAIGMLATMDRVQLRDRQSATDLPRLASQGRLSVSPDIALISPLFWGDRRDNAKRSQHKVLGICVHSRAVERTGEDLSVFIAALVAAASSPSDLQVIRVLVACSDATDGDVDLSDKVVEALRSRTDCVLDLVSYSGANMPEFVEAIHGCSCVLTSRMHVGLAALAAGIPTVQLDYAVKVRDVFGHLGIDGALSDGNPSNLGSLIDGLVRGCVDDVQLRRFDEIRRTLLLAAEEARRDSRNVILQTLKGDSL